MDSSSISSDLIRGHIDTIILKTLMVSDKCATDITKDIENKTAGKYSLKQATLYSALKRLETLKMVVPYWSDYPEGGRRRYFKLSESGKKLVETNLNEWNYSKNILDLLIADKKGDGPTVVVKEPANTLYQQPTSVIKQSELSPVEKNEVQNDKNSFVEKQPSYFTATQPVYKKEPQEVNFRKILNDILKSSNIVEGNASIIEEKIEKKQDTTEKVHISDVAISYDTYDKVDYSDIVEKSLKEGFTVKFSNRPQKNIGSFFINKIKIISAFVIFFAMILQIIGISASYDFITSKEAWISALIPVVFLSVVFLASYKNLLKTSNQAFGSKTWISLIVAINLSLLTFAISLLFNVDFREFKNIVYYLLVPILFYFDIFAYYLLKLVLSKLKIFVTK
ncbi:MAG: hypothetical protein E7342_05370 [Clostridiales bacterium]|nr:hypothetical protein [Clostridiales bacterium]